MAEFEQVARGWKRMCKKFWTTRSCAGCPVAEHWQMYEYCKEHMPDDIDFKKFEELVMAWVAEHPEPVYPSWLEWLNEKGIVIYKPVSETESRATIFAPLALTPIPADIAKKLGIEPKKVTKDG